LRKKEKPPEKSRGFFVAGDIELSARDISIKDFLKVVEFNENFF